MCTFALVSSGRSPKEITLDRNLPWTCKGRHQLYLQTIVPTQTREQFVTCWQILCLRTSACPHTAWASTHLCHLRRKDCGWEDANTSPFTLWTCGCHFVKQLAFPLSSSGKMAYELYWNVYAGVSGNLRDNALKSHLLWLETTDWIVKWLISSHKLKADIANNH